MAKMCMKFDFISICTYLCGVCPMYCSCSNYFGPKEFGHHFVLEFVLGTFGDALEACLIYKEGVVTMCLLEPSLNDHELLSSTSPMLSR